MIIIIILAMYHESVCELPTCKVFVIAKCPTVCNYAPAITTATVSRHVVVVIVVIMVGYNWKAKYHNYYNYAQHYQGCNQ